MKATLFTSMAMALAMQSGCASMAGSADKASESGTCDPADLLIKKSEFQIISPRAGDTIKLGQQVRAKLINIPFPRKDSGRLACGYPVLNFYLLDKGNRRFDINVDSNTTKDLEEAKLRCRDIPLSFARSHTGEAIVPGQYKLAAWNGVPGQHITPKTPDLGRTVTTGWFTISPGAGVKSPGHLSIKLRIKDKLDPVQLKGIYRNTSLSLRPAGAKETDLVYLRFKEDGSLATNLEPNEYKVQEFTVDGQPNEALPKSILIKSGGNTQYNPTVEYWQH